MRGTLALIRFELERQWMVVATAAVTGLLGLAVPWFPGGPSRLPANELRTVAVGVSVVVFLVLLAMSLGASLVARDLAERRASFLFSRPLSTANIALGRLGAALLLLGISVVLIVTPVTLAGAAIELPTERLEAIEGFVALLAFVGLAAVALFVSSAFVLSARARTAWVVLELAALVATGLAITRAFELLRTFHLQAAPEQLTRALAIAAPFVFLLVFLVPFFAGRTELARAHRAQALAVALLLPATGGAALLWVNDYVHPSAQEIVRGALWAESIGQDRFAVIGSEPGRDQLMASAIVDGRSGKSLLASRVAHDQIAGEAIIDCTGGFCYWPEHNGDQVVLMRARATSGPMIIEPTRVEFDRFPNPWAISHDGRLFAGLEPTGDIWNPRLVLVETASGRLLRSERFVDRQSWGTRIGPEGGGFRLVSVDRNTNGVSSWLIDATGRRTLSANEIIVGFDFLWWLDDTSGRVFVKQGKPSPKGWLVLDAGSLQPIFRAEARRSNEPGVAFSPFVALLPDGGIAFSVRRDKQRELALHSGSGELLRTIDWTGHELATQIGVGTNALLVATRARRADEDDSRSLDTSGWTILRLDFNDGSQREVARDFLPIRGNLFLRPGPALLRDDDGNLFSLDPDSGELKKLDVGL